MKDYFRTFLNEDWEAVPEAPQVYVGSFGKHPGWNDHLDDLGLVTGSLATARRILYGSGIASQIEKSAWEKLGPGKALEAFDHVFLWRRPREAILGLLWASRDGKGRSHYPMVACVHAVGQPLEWLAARALPALEEAAAQCREVTEAGRVVAVLDALQNALRATATAASADGEVTAPAPCALGVGDWAAHFEANREPLTRIFHHVEGRLRSFAPGATEWSNGGEGPASADLRFPVVPGASPFETLNAWTAFTSTQVDPALPVLAFVPRGQAWVDVFAGLPDPDDFFCLKATPEALPRVTDIPYTIDEMLRARLASVFDDLAMRRLPGFSLLNGDSVEDNREAAAKALARFRPSARKGLLGRVRSLTRFGFR